VAKRFDDGIEIGLAGAALMAPMAPSAMSTPASEALRTEAALMPLVS